MSTLDHVSCGNCGEPLSLQESLRERPVDGVGGAREIGLFCPNCGSWTHSYFTNQRLDHLLSAVRRFAAAAAKGDFQDRWRYAKLRRRYQREFHAFNTWLRRQHGEQPFPQTAGAPVATN